MILCWFPCLALLSNYTKQSLFSPPLDFVSWSKEVTHELLLLFYLYFKLDLPSVPLLALFMGFFFCLFGFWPAGGECSWCIYRTSAFGNLSFKQHLCFMLHHRKTLFTLQQILLESCFSFYTQRNRLSLSLKEEKHVGSWLNRDWISCCGYYITSNWDYNAGSLDSSLALTSKFAPLASSVGSAFHRSRIQVLFPTSSATTRVQAKFLSHLNNWWLQQPSN